MNSKKFQVGELYELYENTVVHVVRKTRCYVFFNIIHKDIITDFNLQAKIKVNEQGNEYMQHKTWISCTWERACSRAHQGQH